MIARKVSQCSKTQRGADAFAAFTTVIRTIAKRANTSIAQGLHSLLHPKLTRRTARHGPSLSDRPPRGSVSVESGVVFCHHFRKPRHSIPLPNPAAFIGPRNRAVPVSGLSLSFPQVQYMPI